jgi:transcriptional regulator with XRE-family HTH domain
MSEHAPLSSSVFRAVFCARIKSLRQASGMTQAEMADILGVGAEAYRTYESRVPLPHHLIEQFARVTGIDIDQLFESGESESALGSSCRIET